ncbi:hypothetical protein PMAYCL1PPCAC_15141, partial [Pristionchus mayeri]
MHASTSSPHQYHNVASCNCGKCGIMHFFIAAAGPIYMALFTYRHQLIIPPGSRFTVSTTAQIILFLILAIPFTSIGVSYSSINVSILSIENSTAYLEV